MQYVFETPQRIITGWGTIACAGPEIASIGKRALLIYSARMAGSRLIEDLVSRLEQGGTTVWKETAEPGEPTVEGVESILFRAELHEADVVVGVGGGSILDIAKAVAGLKVPGRRPVKDYFYGHPISGAGIPWVAIPTTSGTGAEATPNSVLSDGKKLKQSIRGDWRWLAKLVILDPELTVSCSANVTAWSGMDALTQAIESYTSTGANVLTEPYSLRAASLISKSLVKACENPADRQARTDMAYGSLLAGIALANARLGIVHGVAHSLGLLYSVPHGLVCGALLPWAVRYNEPVCADRYGELARAMNIGNGADDLLAWISATNKKLGIPSSVKAFGFNKEDIPRIVEESMPSGSLKANPRPTSPADLAAFLEDQLTVKPV